MKEEIRHSELALEKLVGKQTGFTAPKNYFCQVEDRLLFELENPLSSTEGFGIPEAYFESLDDTILSRIAADNTPQVISLRQRLTPWISLAAAACIVVFIGFSFWNSNMTELTDDDIVNWFEGDVNAVSNEDFALAFDEADLNDLKTTLDAVKDASIEEYLLNEDITSILEEYN